MSEVGLGLGDCSEVLASWYPVFRDAPTGMWLAVPGRQGALLDVNASLCSLYEMSREELLATSKADLIQFGAPGELHEAPDPLAHVPGQSVSSEHTVVLQDGSIRYVAVTATLIDTVAGRRSLAHFADVTAIRRAEAELRLAVESQEAMFAVLPDQIHVADAATGEHVWNSKSAHELAPVHPGDAHLLASSIRDVARADDGQVINFRHRALAADGSLTWFDRRKSPFQRDAEGVVKTYVGITRDVTDQVLAEEALRDSLAFQDSVLTSSPDTVTVFDVDSRQSVWASRSIVQILGYSLDEVRQLQANMNTFIHPDDLERLQQTLEDAKHLDDGQVAVSEMRALHANGSWCLFERRSTPLRRSDSGEVTQVLSVTRDVTEQRATAAKLDDVRAFQDAVIGATPDIVMIIDNRSGRMTWSSRPIDGLLGWTREDIERLGDRPMESLVHPEHLARFHELEREAHDAAVGEVVQGVYKARHKDGRWRWMSRRMTPFIQSEGGAGRQTLVMVRDATEGVETQKQLEHAALHDPLTGLPNRRLVVDRLKTALAATSRGGHVAVLYIDLDGFKRINDAFGHPAGDAVLIETAARLADTVRPGDTVARMGGDEFVVILQHVDSSVVEEVARAISDRLRDQLARPTSHQGIEHTVTASIGIATATSRDGADDVLRNADSAMYRAKTGGKNRLAVFDPDQHLDAVRRSETEKLLRGAIGTDRIEVVYQPVVATTNGQLLGVEALLRIRDHHGHYLDTQQVVTVAEQTGLIAAIGQQVLATACAQAQQWDQNIHVAVNMSALEIATPNLYGRLIDTLTSTGLDPHRLVLELTETVLLEAAHSTIRDLERLREAGIGISIDDFGTGYASLRYLATLPATSVKVDRSFTAGIGLDPVSATLVSAITNLARDLGLDCIVEGVETQAQLDFLGHHPHVHAQGYFLGKPAACRNPQDLLIRRPSLHV